MKIKTLNGREASILALLAQCPKLKDRDRIIGMLKGSTKAIAKQIVYGGKADKNIKLAAKGFLDWVNRMKKNGR